MADFAISPAFLETVQTTAVARISNAVTQRLTPATVGKIQQLLQFKSFIGGVLGLDDNQDIEQPLLGGLTLAEARDICQQLDDAQLARKNLFFIQVVDPNPPPLEYAPGTYATSLFNLFALDVSYSPNTVTGEKIAFGSAFMDKPTGIEHTEMSITTMDDSRGSLKRWFEGKTAQAAHQDGTFGLPSEYWLDIYVYHATAKANENAFMEHFRMRTQGIQREMSRRDQALSELQMTFTQFDSFVVP